MKLTSIEKLVSTEESVTFYQQDSASYHHPMLLKARAMFEYQLLYTPGYIGAYMCTLRHFPLKRIHDLFVSVGSLNDVAVCVITGRNDKLVPSLGNDKEIASMFRCNEESSGDNEGTSPHEVHCLGQCGHHVVFEAFDEVVEIIVRFLKTS